MRDTHAPPETVCALVAAAREDGRAEICCSVLPFVDARLWGAVIQGMLATPSGRRLAAAAAGLPRAAAEVLMETGDRSVWRRLARNPACPPVVLSQLCRLAMEDPDLACDLVRHPGLAEESMALLAGHRDAYVRTRLLSRPGLAASLLEALVPLVPREHRWQAARQKFLTPAQMDRWVADASAAELAEFIRHPSATEDRVRRAAASSHLVVRRAVAQRPSLSRELQAALAADADWSVRASLARRVDLDGRLLSNLLTDDHPAVRRECWSHQNPPAGAFLTAAGDADVWVREAVARHPSLPARVMDRLAGDSDRFVRRAVGRNPACTPDWAARLAADADPWVRAAIAYRADISVPVLRTLANDVSPDVLSGVATSPYLATQTQRRLVAHPSADVRRALVFNPNIRRSVAAALCEDPYPFNRLMAVQHGRVTRRQRWSMRHDPDLRVGSAVFVWFAQDVTRRVTRH